MATTSDIRNGLCIKYNNDIYKIIEFLHVKPGKGPAFVRTVSLPEKYLITHFQVDIKLKMYGLKPINFNFYIVMVNIIIL